MVILFLDEAQYFAQSSGYLPAGVWCLCGKKRRTAAISLLFYFVFYYYGMLFGGDHGKRCKASTLATTAKITLRVHFIRSTSPDYVEVFLEELQTEEQIQ